MRRNEREVKRDVAIRRRNARACTPITMSVGSPHRPATICETSFMSASVRAS